MWKVGDRVRVVAYKPIVIHKPAEKYGDVVGHLGEIIALSGDDDFPYTLLFDHPAPKEWLNEEYPTEDFAEDELGPVVNATIEDCM